MTTLWFSRRALADVERLAAFLRTRNPQEATETVELITGAVQVLRTHPLIGRRVRAGLRELVISRGRSGYLALYVFDPRADEVTIHAVRHQREAGYWEH